MQYFRDLSATPYTGLNYNGIKFIPTGFSTDNLTNCLMTGKLTFVTGQTEEGKSVVVHRIILNAIDNGYKVLLVDGEHDQDELINKLYIKIIGHDKTYYHTKKFGVLYSKEPTAYALERLQKWHKDKLYIFSKNLCDVDNLERLYDLIDEVVKKEHIDLVVLDNMMSLVTSSDSEKNSAQARFTKRTIAMNRQNNCHSIIVNHPKKNKEGERGVELDVFSMSGTSDMPNLADNIFIVRRNYTKENERINYPNARPESLEHANEPDGWLYLKKNRLTGKHAKVNLIYDIETQNYLEQIGNQAYAIDYNWQGNGKQQGFVNTDDYDF